MSPILASMVEMSGVMRAILATAALLFGPIIIAVIMGFIQLGVYRLMRRFGWVTTEAIPMFPILMMRGLFLVLAGIAVMVFYFRIGAHQLGWMPGDSGAAPAGGVRAAPVSP